MMRVDQKSGSSPRAGIVREITSTANPVIKEIRALSMKKHRDRTGLFMAEGLKLLTDAVSTGWQIETVICAKEKAADQEFAHLAAKCRAAGADVLEVNKKVLSAVSKRDNPQMVIGVYRQKYVPWQDLVTRLEKPGDIVVAIDRVRDPGNLGTIIRTADAGGIRGIVLIGDTTDPFSLEATRATMGSIFHVPIAKVSQEVFIAQRPGGTRIAGTHLEGAVDYRSLPWAEKPAIILMGNEQQGLTDALRDCCDDVILIPMAGQADSLNLAVATALTVFEARRAFLSIEEMQPKEQIGHPVENAGKHKT